MARPKKTTAIAIAAGVLALGGGVGAATLASADPTPSPSTSPGTSAGTQALGAAPDGSHGPRGWKGNHEDEFAKSLASKLGVTEAKVTEALKAFRDENRPTAPPSPGTARPDPAGHEAALAKALASKLGVSEAKVTAALEELRTAAQAEQAAALKDKLDAAVKGGTLTQAEADAVTKAVEKGVISGGFGLR